MTVCIVKITVLCEMRQKIMANSHAFRNECVIISRCGQPTIRARDAIARTSQQRKQCTDVELTIIRVIQRKFRERIRIIVINAWGGILIMLTRERWQKRGAVWWELSKRAIFAVKIGASGPGPGPGSVDRPSGKFVMIMVLKKAAPKLGFNRYL
jgi:hypothetical protein